jgi:hypothetical protein
MNVGGHLALLRAFLERRRDIVEQIDRDVLNVRGKGVPGLPRELSRMEEELAASHLADGFDPIAFEGSSHDFDPPALVARAHRHWEHHRWPGRNVRLPFAGRVLYVFILRQLQHLSLRIWDAGDDAAAARLQEIQALLDALNGATIGDALVRDARWLIQTAQGPLTRRLDPYFRIAERISASFSSPGGLDIHKAGAVLTSGHLRSQLRHRAAETSRPIDDPEVLATTRNSNSMDAALLVRDLVPLLEAYGTAEHARPDLADAIFQGVSADPELFLTRLDLLGPCTMIEDLFVVAGEEGQPRRARAQYSPMGLAHNEFLERYARLIGQHAESLHEDAIALDPRDRAYSPLGIAYGFCADLLSNMALDTLLAQPSFGLGLENLFSSRDSLDHKRARAEGWKDGYSDAWAALMFDRTMDALRARARYKDRANASAVPDARLFLDSAPEGAVPAQEHCVASDLQRALASGATAFPKGQIVRDRNEGRFLASANEDGKWFGISKVILTLCTSQGHDALLIGVPPPVVDTLRLTCPGLVVMA